MANDEKKKPLVLLDAANPSPRLDINPAIVSGWNDDGAPLLTYDQVESFRDTGNSGLVDNGDTKPNNSPSTTTSTTTQPNTKASNSNPQPKSSDYLWDDIFNKMEEEGKAYRIRTPEEIERQRKADKRNALFAAIGDGVSALSNLYFTTKGAPSVERGGKTLSEAQQEASDKWWRDEKEAREAYIRNRINALRTRQQKDYYDWRQQNGEDKLDVDKKYKEDKLNLDKEREARLKRQQQLKESEAEFKALALSGKLNQQQWAAIQRWYSAATKGNPGPFPNVGADVQKALIQRYPNAFEGVAFTQQPTAPAVAPTVTVTPKSNKRGSSSGRGRGGTYNPSRDPGMEKVVEHDDNGTTRTYYQRRGSGSGGSKYSNTKNLAKNKGL